MSLPKLNLQTATKSQQEHLAQWLAAWELDQILADDPATIPGAAFSMPCADDDSAAVAAALQSGQIRLLMPGLGKRACSLPDRLRFFAVLQLDEGQHFLLAPFSRFTVPGLPGELLLRREAGCVRVLCLWNCRQVSDDIAQASRLVDKLALDELQDARAVLAHHGAGSALSGRLEDRVGPDCWHPADPRHAYQREERHAWWVLLQGFGPDEDSLPLAAEGAGPYDA